eukprot:CAMPEP_0118813168 /NCGR_PEP_ID=MMETSP1162-20130426/2750_1 /TAXON_ID=33656 /ORGANISM="Phaeocystis Sp, Strain CCMP2710" /LENGTH=453 /DNA_ID=CAMNT_0006742933 /DNA_START=263 /DNA_END=1622 /DNA_ORIENTATION=+
MALQPRGFLRHAVPGLRLSALIATAATTQGTQGAQDAPAEPVAGAVAFLLGLAAFHVNVLQQTVGPEGETFDTDCDEGVYNGVEPLSWIPEQVSALEYLCKRLAFAPFRCSPADPAAAAEYKGEIAEVWRNNPGLTCGIGSPEAPFLEDTVEGASVSTWPRYHNALNVYGLAAFLEATPTKAFFQTAHAAMRRSGVKGLFTLSLTICISLCSFAMLGLCLALRQFDGQCLTDLTGEKTTAGSDGLEHLVAPSDLGSYECYAALFRKLLDGRLAFLFVDGALGRKCLMRYIKEHNGCASPLSQQTLCMLNQNKCDFDTDLIATNAGAIFLLYIHGSMHLVFLRPSIGSWFFELQRAHAKRGQADALKIVHNQLWLLSIFMCIDTVDVFRTATSVLLAMMQTANQEAVTAFLHARGWLAEHVSFVTPWSLGGKVCYALKRGIFDPANAALVAAGR